MTMSNQPPSTSQTYQSEGGELKATATTTTTDGSTVQDCVTFYLEGPAGGIPDPSITSQLTSLYEASKSYPTDGTATPNLMTGIAEHESSYHQFLTPAEPPYNFDLFKLDSKFGIAAKWPFESQVGGVSNGGTNIGLMQVATSSINTWKWQDPTPAAAANANDGVNLFSGTATPNKVSIATGYVNDIFNGVKSAKIPAHVGMGWTQTPLSGLQMENMALVLYRGAGVSTVLASTLNELYYIPVCTGTISNTSKGWTRSTKWYWAVNDSQVDGNVQVSNIFPQGTTGNFGNHKGVVYVSNQIILNDVSFGAGVRKQLQ
jgi:hypothetical protein